MQLSTREGMEAESKMGRCRVEGRKTRRVYGALKGERGREDERRVAGKKEGTKML